MSSIDFPNPRTHKYVEWVLFGDYFYNASDIVLFGGELTTENLRNAYRRGIFPWTIEGAPLPWFCPEKRAVLEFENLHVGRNLRKLQRKEPYRLTIDSAFSEVMKNCARVKRSHESGTWISEKFIETYTELHRQGAAHSVEARDANGDLVGGLYGVDAGGVFCGESMFHLKSDASKLALLHLIEHLQNRGATWLDVQVMTPHFETFGAEEISRSRFLTKLAETQEQKLNLF